MGPESRESLNVALKHETEKKEQVRSKFRERVIH
jgi:hypothetical protein